MQSAYFPLCPPSLVISAMSGGFAGGAVAGGAGAAVYGGNVWQGALYGGLAGAAMAGVIQGAIELNNWQNPYFIKDPHTGIITRTNIPHGAIATDSASNGSSNGLADPKITPSGVNSGGQSGVLKMMYASSYYGPYAGDDALSDAWESGMGVDQATMKLNQEVQGGWNHAEQTAKAILPEGAKAGVGTGINSLPIPPWMKILFTGAWGVLRNPQPVEE